MIGITLQDRYRTEQELGRGGMGVVYRAYDTLLGRAVAVKVLSDTWLGSEGRARLLHEAQAAAKLNHPNIVAVYDAGEHQGLPFIVMELVEGPSLRDSPPQELEGILRVARQVCAALEHAHSHGIVHRDLKPENVLIGPDGSAKLMDFGLARSVASRVTQEGALVGTVYYLAPEQALGQAVDGRADLYALGVMLYELTTGRLPFVADDLIAVISQHLHAPVVPPRSFRADLPPGLEAVILRLLAKHPEERPPSAREVEAALIGAFGVLASPPKAELPEAPRPAMLLAQLAAGRLVGRRAELAQLRELWGHARQGHAYLALVSGEPGVGKTRLANELAVVAQLGGALVLRGGCYEYEAATPYLPFVEALRAWVHNQEPDSLRAYLDTSAAEIVKLAPELEAKLGPISPNPPLTPNEERLRLFDNVARLFQRLAAGHGLLFFVDDLHWADQGSLHLLHYLLRHLREDPVLLLAAYREVELDRTHPLAAALVEWHRERLATRVALGRLSPEETGALLAALFQEEGIPSEFSDAIYRETEGNPFFVEEVIKALVEQGEVVRQEGRWQRTALEELAIPQSVKEAIGRRLDRLSPACIEALHTASALGKTFEYAELAAVASSPEDRLLDALDEAASAQLIRAGDGESFGFTHDKIREVLYEELNPIRRRRLHQRIGEGLEQLYEGQAGEGHVQDLAYHFVQSGDLARGLKYARRAGEQAARLYAHDEALGYYQQAAECAEALHLEAPLAEIYAAVGSLQTRRGFYYPAVEAYERALSLTEAAEERAALKTKMGVVYAQMGGDPRGVEILLAAQRELNPATQVDELAHNLTSLGRYHHYRAEHSQAIAYLEQARELAEPLDHAPTLTYIYSYLAGSYQHLAHFEQSMEWARRCVALGERKGYPLAVAAGFEFLAEDNNLLGQWQEGLDYALRDRQIGDDIGSLDRVAWADYSLGYALFGQGRLREGRDVAAGGLAAAERIGDRRLVVWFSGLLGCLEADLGEDEAGLAHVEQAVGLAEELGQVALQCGSLYAAAYRHIRQGQYEPALELCRRGRALHTPTENRVGALYIGAVAGEALCGAGELEEAARETAGFLALTREAAARHWEGVALRAQGRLLAIQARWDEADQVLNPAVALFEQLGSRLELGRALVERALARQATGCADLARADAAQATALFEACGVVRDAQQAHSLLQMPGV